MNYNVTILLFFVSICCYSQCNITLDNFILISDLNENQLETKVIGIGFEYDHTRNVYLCTQQNISGANDQILRKKNDEGFDVTAFTFNNVKKYLEYKTKLEDEGLYLMTDEKGKDTKTRGYEYQGRIIFLSSTTRIFNNERLNLYNLMMLSKVK